ncbi:hypothetical protein OG21DRAFT_1499327 [Imleria badia]|nr:hypothetical protein OG21DRAFT_1499327 [Imleria badia]
MPKNKKMVQPKPPKPLYTDPKGWSTPRISSSDIHNVLEDPSGTHYIYSSKNPAQPADSEAFYLWTVEEMHSQRVESPCTQKALWEVLQHRDWFHRLVLKDLAELPNEDPLVF